ncbi:hypothetical protein [Chamaesiphon polymorphus]|uniref:Uncharacterized protein n=1 Tax=Chamaesiphon polymorphus CCALA 037 TaxID=2107692 RepID=A0A2T1F9E0_9CYAN|nr:hypothetical protein [Chamaesiphon polymorphus]PSB41630.1 hypothetical protein C7B77_27265 [Chamaesiphon polymorphus CCALA 037]
MRIAKFNSIANTVRTAKFKATAKFTYFSITTLAIIFYLAGVAKAETPANNNPIRATFSQLTVNSMAASPTGMSAAIPPQAQPMFGGLTRVTCRAGQAPSTCLPLGFLNTAFGIGKFTPQTAAKAAGKPALTGAETLATATPWLGKIAVKDALAGNPSLAAVLPQSAFVSGGSGGGKIVNPNLQSTPFGSVVDLKSIQLKRVPSLANTPLNNFAGIQKLTTSQIPNIGNIAFANMPSITIPAGAAAMKMDVVRTQERNVRHMVMSGSEQQPNASCQSNCDYIETHPVIGMPYLKGARIISGDSLQVRGGKGLLAWVNGGKEPTGIHFSGMKFVVRNVNAKQGTATVNLNFRSCFYAFGEHCTPYFIGFPLWQLSERRNSFPLITTDASVVRLIRLQK